jgi:hypothetical protein
VTAKRPALDRALDELEAGDVLVVTKLDRLARSTLDLLIAKEGAGFKSLGDPWADTTTAHGRLMLTVLSGIAEFERDLIVQRTSEGRARAMAEGIRFGRRPKLSKHQAREALKRVAEGEPLREIALSYNVDHSTISRLKVRYHRGLTGVVLPGVKLGGERRGFPLRGLGADFGPPAGCLWGSVMSSKRDGGAWAVWARSGRWSVSASRRDSAASAPAQPHRRGCRYELQLGLSDRQRAPASFRSLVSRHC